MYLPTQTLIYESLGSKYVHFESYTNHVHFVQIDTSRTHILYCTSSYNSLIGRFINDITCMYKEILYTERFHDTD